MKNWRFSIFKKMPRKPPPPPKKEASSTRVLVFLFATDMLAAGVYVSTELDKPLLLRFVIVKALSYSHAHNIFRLFDGRANFPFTINVTKHDY